MPLASPTVVALSDQDPRELGQYRVAGRLGSGGMGSVYLAEGPTGLVAIKVIKPHLAHDPEFLRRFRQEVAAARKVSRWCTAPVLDGQLAETPLWVVTEYVPGLDLGRHVKEHGPLTGAAGEALAVGVAVALSAIHQAGIVHRDLKPGNVLLSPFGPRVIDFGISRALDTEQATRSGQMLGTPGYMAPELFSGQVEQAADIFAWGCVVAAATSTTTPGRSPFAADNMMQAFHRVMQEEPDLNGVEPTLRELVRAALARDPAARPTAEELVSQLSGPGTTVAEVARTLRLGVGYGPAMAPPPPAARPAWRLRDLAIGAGAGVAAVGLVTGVVAGLRALPPSPPEGTETLYDETFSSDDSGWDNSGLTSPTTERGYTGQGRYTMAEDYSNTIQWSTAPVNAVLPDRSLVSVKMDLSQAVASWNGVFCEYSKTDDAKDDLIYMLQVSSDGKSKITKVAGTVWEDLTPDLTIPPFDQKAPVQVRAECVREGDEVRVALWLGDELVAEHVDQGVTTAAGRPRFGLYMSAGKDSKSRVSYDDFTIARLS
ncbi:serine/threonine-protein kinase [Nonomuraea jiangxiensis]|uniref:Serine/threonine protein kinase n=1 Tax=Nonomuraea jiangxiensis TaxID=633440 RepID=A0A1G9D646_9ACTN|nr:serine/threonine-protein kinase [Nonomuraea jiangxiensis]SDK59145.1 Serine/threonine protein kinase [Nonomuraea jiangxiensis]